MNTLFDSRWCGNHGIGRFANELKNRCFADASFINGNEKSALKPLDFLWIDQKMCTNTYNLFFSPSFNVPYLNASRSIFTIHDLMHLDFKEYRSLPKTIYYEYFVKHACKKGLKILTVSEYSKQRIVNWSGVNSEKVVVVGCGVDDIYKPLEKKRTQNSNYILYLGNKKPHKNIERMIQAFVKSKAVNDFKFKLNGNATPALKRLIDKLKLASKVEFIGFIDEKDMPALYQHAHITLNATLIEGFGLPIIESMACGTPVVTSNITSMPEIAGSSAILVDPYDIDSISEGIDLACYNQSLRNQLILKGVQRAKLFNWNTVANKVNCLLKEFLNV